ncbi:Carbohydrate-binding/sugar hydrolysis domain-containing protein OS=Streptomyces violarus OX=67380 GN=FHS41_008053 PE=4 SV=1 [Streptomyces violarus]
MAEAITHEQHNRWHDNVYRGPWKFVVQDPSQVLDPGHWQGPPYQQDAGSTFAERAGG